MTFRGDIQGLRALAFILVFIFHLNHKLLPGGFLGVDLFFVISGYLITTIILHDLSKKKFSFTSFFNKRIKRIVPAYLGMLLVVALAGSLIYMDLDVEYLKKSLFNSLGFVSNNQFSHGDSYFGAKLSENPLLHTWSLSIEMQFYLILPLILYFFRRSLLAVISIIVIILTCYATYNLHVLHNNSQMYFSFLGRVPEFLIGAFYSIRFKEGIDYGRKTNNVISFVSLLALLSCAFTISENSNFPGFLALVPCVAAGNLLATKNNFISDFFAKKVPVYIGELSYSLYLWHWPIMALIRYKYDRYDFDFAQIIFIVSCTFAFSWLSYTFIENRFRKLSNKRTYAYLAPAAACFLFFVTYIAFITSKNAIPDLYSKPTIGLASHLDGKIEKFGDLTRDDSIFLIGDSHALMIKPFLDYVGRKQHFSFKTLTCDGYPAIKGIRENEVPKDGLNFYKNSQKFIHLTKSQMDKSKIIIINSTGFNRIPSLEAALESLAKSLKVSQKLILINSFPRVDINPLKVNNGFVKKNNLHFEIQRNAANKRILERIAHQYKNVYLYDLEKSRIFKNVPYLNDTILYYNKSHINTYASLKLAEDLETNFIQFLAPIMTP
jgi:peptidoglycan/LPS O-acetylase OafA/YrhL